MMSLDTELLQRFAQLAADALGEARAAIDDLNVYPVPDGDTGTNLYLTVVSARDGLLEGGRVADFSRGALLGARGNSGVILAEMLGAFVRHAAPEMDGVALASALRAASEASYAAVGTPVEGTILTVGRAAAEAAEKSAAQGSTTTQVIVDAARAARDALARTPEQLAVLRDSGVVDAGGAGLCVVLDAAAEMLTGERAAESWVVAPRVGGSRPRRGREPTTRGATTHDSAATTHDSVEGPAFEVMYLLDAADDAITGLRSTLAPLGDSLVVVGGEGLWNVHVHVDDVGAAIEAGVAAGRPYRIKVTHFATQVGAHDGSREGRAVVAVAAGPGLHALFAAAGATVVDGGPGRRASAGELLAAVDATGAREVVVLPNDPDTVRAAEVAARAAAEQGIRVEVIPTHAQVQGIAALAVHDEERTFDRDVLEMTATSAAVRHGAVTIAAKEAMTMAGRCHPGDVLGVVDGDFVVIGSDLVQVAREVIERLLGGGGELVTLVSGAEDPEGQVATATCAWLAEDHRPVDAVVYDGCQDRYPLLISVE